VELETRNLKLKTASARSLTPNWIAGTNGEV